MPSPSRQLLLHGPVPGACPSRPPHSRPRGGRGCPFAPSMCGSCARRVPGSVAGEPLACAHIPLAGTQSPDPTAMQRRLGSAGLAPGASPRHTAPRSRPSRSGRRASRGGHSTATVRPLPRSHPGGAGWTLPCKMFRAEHGASARPRGPPAPRCSRVRVRSAAAGRPGRGRRGTFLSLGSPAFT